MGGSDNGALLTKCRLSPSSIPKNEKPFVVVGSNTTATTMTWNYSPMNSQPEQQLARRPVRLEALHTRAWLSSCISDAGKLAAGDRETFPFPLPVLYNTTAHFAKVLPSSPTPASFLLDTRSPQMKLCCVSRPRTKPAYQLHRWPAADAIIVGGSRPFLFISMISTH